MGCFLWLNTCSMNSIDLGTSLVAEEMLTRVRWNDLLLFALALELYYLTMKRMIHCVDHSLSSCHSLYDVHSKVPGG